MEQVNPQTRRFSLALMDGFFLQCVFASSFPEGSEPRGPDPSRRWSGDLCVVIDRLGGSCRRSLDARERQTSS